MSSRLPSKLLFSNSEVEETGEVQKFASCPVAETREKEMHIWEGGGGGERRIVPT